MSKISLPGYSKRSKKKNQSNLYIRDISEAGRNRIKLQPLNLKNFNRNRSNASFLNSVRKPFIPKMQLTKIIEDKEKVYELAIKQVLEVKNFSRESHYDDFSPMVKIEAILNRRQHSQYAKNLQFDLRVVESEEQFLNAELIDLTSRGNRLKKRLKFASIVPINSQL